MEKYSKTLDKLISVWGERVAAYHEEAKAVNMNPHLSPFGRSEKVKELQRALDGEREEAVSMWESTWEKIKAEYKASGTSEPTDRATVMQTILAVGGSMTAQMLDDVLKPIEKDVSAIKLVYPIIEKNGLLSAFEETKAHKLYTAASKVEMYIDEAEKLCKQLEVVEDGIKFAITRNYMQSFLEQAEEQMEIVKEMER